MSRLPADGSSKEVLLDRMRRMRGEDARWKEGRTFSLVYYAGEEHSALLKESYTEFMSENGLSPMAFPSLRRFENEVLGMCAGIFHGDTAAGTMTSGGTESVLMAVKTAREWAKTTKGITAPEMILPITAHPAFMKAAHYFSVKPVLIDHGPDYRVDLDQVKAAVNANTVLIVGSAFQYPQGVVDPIPELAAIADANQILCHVDACLGGFVLAFSEQNGVKVPPFDFRVKGVTSISADIHKYGFAAKGASVVLYRDAELRRHQFFTWAEWPGGLYASPSMTGTRPGGAIAAAWAVLNHFGEAGYVKLIGRILTTARKLREGVAAIEGLRVLGEPTFSVFAFGSDEVDVYALGDAMEARGWKLDRQQKPPALHLMLTPAHEPVAELFLKDLRECVSSLKRGEPAPEGSAAMYGMVGSVPDRQMVEGFLLTFMDGVFDPTAG